MLYVFDEAAMLSRFTVTVSEPKQPGGGGGESSGVCVCARLGQSTEMAKKGQESND